MRKVRSCVCWFGDIISFDRFGFGLEFEVEHEVVEDNNCAKRTIYPKGASKTTLAK